MPGSARRPDVLVDTSVAIALVIEDHDSHSMVFDALASRRLGLAGHAAFESYSVLTRLPAPLRLTGRAAHRVLDVNFPASRFLSAQAAAALLGSVTGLGIAGGSVYDALVAAAAREHRCRLATCDRRAMGTYRALDVDVELIG